MAISFLDEQESSSGSLEFASDYLETNPKADKKFFDVTEIYLVKSGKGYMIKTENFACFLWKNSKVAKQLIEALKYYVQKGKGFQIVCQLDKKAKEKYRLGSDNEKPVIWYEVGGKYTTSEDGDPQLSQPQSENPFLIPVP